MVVGKGAWTSETLPDPTQVLLNIKHQIFDILKPKMKELKISQYENVQHPNSPKQIWPNLAMALQFQELLQIQRLPAPRPLRQHQRAAALRDQRGAQGQRHGGHRAVGVRHTGGPILANGTE